MSTAPGHTAVLTMELQRGVVGDLSTLAELRDAVADADLLASVGRLLSAARAVSIPVVHATVGWRSDRLGTPLVTPIARHLAGNPAQLLEGTPAVELDPAMTRLFTDNPALAALNGRALSDPRVRVVEGCNARELTPRMLAELSGVDAAPELIDGSAVDELHCQAQRHPERDRE